MKVFMYPKSFQSVMFIQEAEIVLASCPQSGTYMYIPKTEETHHFIDEAINDVGGKTPIEVEDSVVEQFVQQLSEIDAGHVVPFSEAARAIDEFLDIVKGIQLRSN